MPALAVYVGVVLLSFSLVGRRMEGGGGKKILMM